MGAASSAALAISLQAEREAHQARCISVMHNFDSHTASVGQAQEYAECVNFMHPKEWSTDQVLIAKVWVIYALIAIPVTLCLSGWEWGEAVFNWLVWVVAVPFGLLLVVTGIAFVVTA